MTLPLRYLGSRYLADEPDDVEECPCSEARSADCPMHDTDPDDPPRD